MKLTLLIPAYNEADRIRSTLEVYGQALQFQDAELIVIVNGSQDRTEHLVQQDFIPRFPFIRLIVISEKVGKGGALIRGLSEARGDIIAFTDADGSTPPAALLDLVDKLSEPGILIGSCWLSHSVIGTSQPLSRRLASRLANRLVPTSLASICSCNANWPAETSAAPCPSASGPSLIPSGFILTINGPGISFGY